MKNKHSALQLILTLSKVQAVINRKMDGQLSVHGLGSNDFIILYYLAQAEGKKIRRIDLADKIGVTASGITRMLAPMEKIGLISRESNERDARISYVILTEAGKRLYEEGLVTAEFVASELFPSVKSKKMDNVIEMMEEII